MTEHPGPVPSTIREEPGEAGFISPPWAYALSIWAVLTGLSTMAGPFGTYEALPFAPRLAYWAGVIALSMALDRAARRLSRGQPLLRRLLWRLPYALVLGALVHVLNRLVFAHWGGLADMLWLSGIVLVVACAIELAFAHLRPGTDAPDPVGAGPQPAVAEDPGAVFLRRLPLDKRGPLIRLEAQDHYLKAVTDAGEALVLMRMGDAEAELAEAHGMRVHRSHWVAIDRVRGHLRRDGRDFLITADESEVPVSRSFLPEVKAAGLIHR